MHQAYHLDLETMLSTLVRRQLSGTLTADLPKGKMGRASCHVEVVVDRGKVVFCQVSGSQMHLDGDVALKMIERLGMIPWTFTAVQPTIGCSHVRPGLQHPPSRSVPRQVVALPPPEPTRLPRTHFMVYAHVDGKRTIEEIATLLRANPENVTAILQDLQIWRLVVIE